MPLIELGNIEHVNSVDFGIILQLFADSEEQEPAFDLKYIKGELKVVTKIETFAHFFHDVSSGAQAI